MIFIIQHMGHGQPIISCMSETRRRQGGSPPRIKLLLKHHPILYDQGE